ncbi:MAG: nicotinate-nucleotide adenylyltransferase [Acidobacteriota bacterium]
MIGSDRSPSPGHPLRRVGILGGSFDPVHAGHVALATCALAHLQLDEVRWVPVGQAWQKSRVLTPAEHRVAMVRLATAHEPRFTVDTQEVERAGPSYTLDTVRALQAQAASESIPTQWYLIIGMDQYRNLPTWNGWQELLECVHLAVACRDSETLPNLDLGQVCALPMPPMPVSSTRIRQQLLAGEDPNSLVPTMVSDAVARYIAQHQLYADRQPPLNGHP